MRKLSFVVCLFSLLAITNTGCLKDKDFEDQKYGIQVKEVKAVSFPEELSSPIVLSINSVATSQTVDGPTVVLEQSNPSSSPVTATVQLNPALVVAAGLTAMPNGSFTTGSLAVTIPAGAKKSDPIKITIPNASLLNPSLSYGIGFTIASVDQDYKIAANLKNVVIGFTIKNIYDGKYILKGQFYHPSSAPGYPTFTTPLIQMVTTGPNSVKMYTTIPGLNGAYHPWTQTTGGPFTAFAGQEPEYTISATNAVTVQNTAPGAVTFYTMGKGYNNAGYNSRWDPATKTIYACFGYNLNGTNFDPTTTRMWIDTLIRTGDR